MPGGDYRDALRDRAGWTPDARAAPRRRWRRTGGGACRCRGVHRRPAAGPRGGARLAALRQPDGSADQHDHARSARGPRDDRRSSSSGRPSSPGALPSDAFRAEIRIRHRATPIPATVRRAADGGDTRRWTIETDTPVWAAAPGQAAVLYEGDVVLGGGRIARPTPVAQTAAATARGRRSSARACERRTGAHPGRPGRHLPRFALRPHPGHARAAGCRSS